MAILTDPPEWRVPGPKPPRNIIEEQGWEVASHPPAPWFNWFFHRVFESLLELEAAALARVVNETGVPGIMAGPESQRPAASPETVGRIYIATDTKRVFRDRGNGWDLLNTPEAIGAETPAGAQAKADAAAGAALSAAKAYADGAVAAHAGRTDNPHGVTKSQVGLGNVENYPVASQREAEQGTASDRYMTPERTAQAIASLAPVKSVAGRTGAVTLSKSDVGLGNVENYGIATQAEAEAGSVNNKYMTPLRVAQAIAALHANRRDNPHNVQAQQVPYSSDVSGFTPATVKAALDALAGVRIVEMGSNANGTYVRWENGLQVCFRSVVLNNVVGGGQFLSSGTQLWPAQFSARPFVTAPTYETIYQFPFENVMNTDIKSVYYSEITSTVFHVRMYQDGSGRFQDGDSIDVFVIAIGRWK